VIRIKGSKRGLAMALDATAAGVISIRAWRDARRRRSCAQGSLCRSNAYRRHHCLNFGNPEKPHIMWQFSQVIDGITKACEELDTPITGGNVSFYNETLGEGIYPTPVIGVVGILEDVHKTAKCTSRKLEEQSFCCARIGLATRSMPRRSLGRPEYAKEFWERCGAIRRSWISRKEATLQRALVAMIEAELVESAHDCADGGLGRCAGGVGVAGRVGLSVRLPKQKLALEFVLFRGRCQSRRAKLRPHPPAANPTSGGGV